ncbi:unnamed protein product [Dovyalis caffra]|uniref:non-specific serine/threonine protein kinase n=1 Tax=Dovyalis caffra TaxID=77055 RepID=A0AAV1R6X9_9ROSI|nr:unnamed protein product [Dovyalis caffra]
MISIHPPPRLILNHQTWLFFSFIFSATFLFSLSLCDPRITVSGLYCGSSKSTPAFIPAFVKEMENLSQLITTTRFATYHLNYSSALGIYALAQCHQDLSQTDCLLCYTASRTKLPRCLPFLSARIYLDGCFLRYDNYSFYQESVSSSSFDTVKCGNQNFDDKNHNDVEFLAGVGYAVGNVTIKAVENGGFGVVKVKDIYALAQCWHSVGREGCRGCLEKAGKAARGCVPKREGRGMNAGCYLRYSTTKFYNKGGGDTGNGHRHGFSGVGITFAIVLGTAAFLMLSSFAVYASYVRLLKAKQDKTKSRTVNWKQRFKIILGTAEGLAYLHGGSQVRIIHRDIKSSNVLLDENLSPKIADFGLVRCFGADKSHLSTDIAGTPCNALMESSGSLLQTVWQLYRSNRSVDAVDPCLRDDFPAHEASCVLQIGLLCTQASPALRPSMAQVVHFLTNSDCEIPTPNQPPYMNTSLLESGSSRVSYSRKSLVSNAPTEVEASSASLRVL